MKLSLVEFAQFEDPVPVVIYSLERALYQVMVVVDGREKLLVEESGRTFRRHNLQQVREMLRLLPVSSLVLRQFSAYDEMVGQPPRAEDNLLEIPLSTAGDTHGSVH
jgi:hypothetical protein